MEGLVCLFLSLLMGSVASSEFGFPIGGDAGQSGLIPAPTEWIAFSADAEISRGALVKSGKFYRSSDGSTRLETGAPGRRELTIKNVAQKRMYRCVEKSCVVQSLVGARELGRPPQMTANLAGLTKLSTDVEGFEAYEWKAGTVSVVLPALNFFAVRLQSSIGSERYWNLEVGEQPESLFVPPAGAVLSDAAPK